MTPETDAGPAVDFSNANRWLILGCSGAGKSTLAREMGAALDLPVVHLDEQFWNAGWVETPNDEFDSIVRDLCAADTWVMDGNYSRTLHHRLPRAQVVILLDLPMWQCLWGVLKRSVLYRGQVRPDLPEGCPEQLPDRQFLWWIISYRWRSRPKVLRLVAAAPHVHFVRLRSRAAVRRFLTQLSREKRAA